MNTPEIHVGILTKKQVTLRLHGDFSIEGVTGICMGEIRLTVSGNRLILENKGRKMEFEKTIKCTPCDPSVAYFEVHGVTIGIDFHWEQEEDQKFSGAIKLLAGEGLVTLINVIDIEEYLCSVISSEMKADASLELLKAHAVISRSWLMAQLTKKGKNEDSEKAVTGRGTADDEYIRWFGREDHADFHVCADDHCQRYQGISRVSNENVRRAVSATRGWVLMYGSDICDARYSKCCGGVTERYEHCWDPRYHPYLESFADLPAGTKRFTPDLQDENAARNFILDTPDAFCNTSDKKILSQVLNEYDLETSDFFRWKVRYEQQELSELIRKRSGIDFGQIRSLEPVLRGNSGRLIKLRINGTRKNMVIGKELVIRRWLSKSHLYSSAFVVEEEMHLPGKVPAAFVLRGAGWGHGVGLCQVGAAVMGAKGYAFEEILIHYYRGADPVKIYT